MKQFKTVCQREAMGTEVSLCHVGPKIANSSVHSYWVVGLPAEVNVQGGSKKLDPF